MRPSILLLLSLLLSSGLSLFQRPEISTTVVGGTLLERQLVHSTLVQFTDLGLELPVMGIKLHQDSAPCNGNSGTFSSNTSPWVVNVCQIDGWVVRHELGHAWTAWNLNESDRDRYLMKWEFESWASPETPWRHRASEHAADTIAWGLVRDPLGCYAADGPIAARVAAFRDLVGIEPPRLACDRAK